MTPLLEAVLAKVSQSESQVSPSAEPVGTAPADGHLYLGMSGQTKGT